MVKIHPFRFWCQKVLPLVYDDSLSYYEVLAKVVKYLNNLIKDVTQISLELDELREAVEGIDENELYSIVEKVISEMKEDGTFDQIIANALLKEIVDYNYEQPTLFSENSTLDEYFNQLDVIALSSDWVNSTTLGQTLAGNPIKCYRIGKAKDGNVFRSGLIFADMDAREYQGTFVLANAIKTIVHNLDKEDGSASVHGKKLSDLFTGYYLYVIPTANPDGYKLCMENLYRQLSTSQQRAIRTMVERFIRGGYAGDSDYTPSEYADLLAYCNNDLTTYTFREEDVPHLWHGTIDGTDIHYNCYTNAMKSRLSAYASLNNWPDFPAPRNYYNPTAGFITTEGAVIRDLIENYGIQSVVDMHQRGPTMFFQYKYGGVQYTRNKFIAQKIADATQVPVSQGNSDRIGFMGWFYEQYNYNNPTHFGLLKEIGWSNKEVLVNGASNPLNPSGFMTNPMPRNLQTKLYLNEFPGILEFMYQAVCNMCINLYTSELNSASFASANPVNLPDNQIVVDKAYMLDSMVENRELIQTSYTLQELYENYTSGSMIVLHWVGTNAPSIKFPGSYTSGRLVVFRMRDYGLVLFLSPLGEMWQCEVTAGGSTSWRLCSSIAGYTSVPSGSDGFVVNRTFNYDAVCVAIASDADVNVAVTRTVPSEGAIGFKITHDSETAEFVYFIISSVTYPSV